MDIATILGLLGGFAVIIGTILVSGDLAMFINLPSVIVVLGGTTTSVMMQFTLGQFIGSFKVAMGAFFTKTTASVALIEEAVELAHVVRKEGVLALEEREISHPFLQKGINMCIDGQPPEVVNNNLAKDINLTIEHKNIGIKVFKAGGEIAPAMGMIGTLIGLVAMLSNMDDPKSIGPAMAVALLTTLYGAIVAYVFCLPIAEKLKLRVNEERINKSLILESINGIQDGLHPKSLQELLTNYLPEDQRAQVADDE